MNKWHESVSDRAFKQSESLMTKIKKRFKGSEKVSGKVVLIRDGEKIAEFSGIDINGQKFHLRGLLDSGQIMNAIYDRATFEIHQDGKYCTKVLKNCFIKEGDGWKGTIGGEEDTELLKLKEQLRKKLDYLDDVISDVEYEVSRVKRTKEDIEYLLEEKDEVALPC